MPTNTPDQGITLPLGPDVADAPVAFSNQTAGVESRLVLRYTDLADRVARHPVGVEGQVSHLASENRLEVFDGANWISAHTRGFFAYVRKTAAQVINNSTTLTNDTALLAALPTAGTFGWRCVVYHDSSQVADIKFAWTIPAGATMRWGLHSSATGITTTSGDGQWGSTTTSGTSFAGGGANTSTVMMTIMEGEVTMGGTAGNLQLQWAQNTLEVSDATVRQNSRLEVWRIA